MEVGAWHTPVPPVPCVQRSKQSTYQNTQLINGGLSEDEFEFLMPMNEWVGRKGNRGFGPAAWWGWGWASLNVVGWPGSAVGRARVCG